MHVTCSMNKGSRPLAYLQSTATVSRSFATPVSLMSVIIIVTIVSSTSSYHCHYNCQCRGPSQPRYHYFEPG